MIVTHMGKMGDFIYALPIADWLYKKRNEKITFVLSNKFEPFRGCVSLLEDQEMTERVVLIDHGADNYMMGGQPYRFNPADFGVEGEYVNIGLKAPAERFMTEELARQNGLGWTKDFVLDTGNYTGLKYGAFVTELLPMAVTKIRKEEVFVLNPTVDLKTNLAFAKTAKEVHCMYSGFAVACYFSRIPFILYRESNRPSNDVYFPDNTRYTQVDCWIK